MLRYQLRPRSFNSLNSYQHRRLFRFPRAPILFNLRHPRLVLPGTFKVRFFPTPKTLLLHLCPPLCLSVFGFKASEFRSGLSFIYRC